MEKYFAQGKAEGEKGKKEVVLTVVDNYLNSKDFITKRKEIVEEFLTFEELSEICTKDFQSVGEQVVDLIRQQHPKLDLSFLYVPPPPTDDDGSSPPRDDGSAGGGNNQGHTSCSVGFFFKFVLLF